MMRASKLAAVACLAWTLAATASAQQADVEEDDILEPAPLFSALPVRDTDRARRAKKRHETFTVTSPKLNDEFPVGSVIDVVLEIDPAQLALLPMKVNVLLNVAQDTRPGCDATFAQAKNIPYIPGCLKYYQFRTKLATLVTITEAKQTLRLAIPYSTPLEAYWIGVTHEDGYFIGMAPSENTRNHANWIGYGQSHIKAVAAVDCQLHGGHRHCGESAYCDSGGRCTECQWCKRTLDAFDHVCPDQCGASTFGVGDHLPAFPETESTASGAVKDAVAPGCPTYRRMVRNNNGAIDFAPAVNGSYSDARRMSTRLSTKVNKLAEHVAKLKASQPGLGGLSVLKAYEHAESSGDVTHHNEGRAAVVTLTYTSAVAEGVQYANLVALAHIAASAADVRFDFVKLASRTTLYLSVVPDKCRSPVDLMFLLDESGSIEMSHYGGAKGNFKDKMIGFVKSTVPLFSYGDSDDASRIAVSAYATQYRTLFHLDAHTSAEGLNEALDKAQYKRGGTRTKTGLKGVLDNLLDEQRGLQIGRASCRERV